MTQETIRVYDLANEMKISNKEVIDLLEKKIQVKVKSHSSTLTSEQVKRFKELMKEPSQKVSSKPKAFIVKKAKPQTQEVVETPVVKKEESIKKDEPVVIKPRLGPKIVQRAEDRYKAQPQPKKEQMPRQATIQPTNKPASKFDKQQNNNQSSGLGKPNKIANKRFILIILSL